MTPKAPPEQPPSPAAGAKPPRAQASQPIGVLDSGVGGLTVVRALLQELPAEQLLYLGDTARGPYGGRSPATVLRASRAAARFLLSRGVKVVLVACHSTSAAALPALAAELPVPLLGTIAPVAAAAAAACQSGTVGVLGTQCTVRTEAYPRALLSLKPGLRVVQLACPLLVPLVEEAGLAADEAVPELVARRYLTELHRQAPELDTLVLGCTHYPLLAPLLGRVAADLWGRELRLVDGAQPLAQAARAELARLGLLGPPREEPGRRRLVDRLHCCVTDEARVLELGARFLGRDLGDLEAVEL